MASSSASEDIRGVLGLLPEVGAVTIGFAMLMICGEFDLSVGSVFAIMPMSIALMLNAGVPFRPAFAVGLTICAIIGFLNAFITLRFDIPSFITTGKACWLFYQGKVYRPPVSVELLQLFVRNPIYPGEVR